MTFSLIKYTLQRVKNYFWHFPKSLFYSLIYRFPYRKLVLIGVTGTDGKTTTAALIHRVLLNAGKKTDLITTINSPGLHTTSPDPSQLLKILSAMVKKGVTHVVIETTAHGLDQYRFFGYTFNISVLTNFTHEHLDDFINLKRYSRAKYKLFQNSKLSVLNADDPSFEDLKKILPQKNIKSYGIDKPSHYQANNVKITTKSLSFDVNQIHFITNSNYHYQVYNILAAFAVADHFQVPRSVFLNTIKQFPEVTGRRQVIANDLNINTIVDFAHTPNALKQTLLSLRINTPGKLIIIFGATGERDQTKRPLMGKVVSELADIAIITSDDTRNEKIEHINQQIIAGINKLKIKRKQFIYHIKPNRQEAFNFALKLAHEGDTIVACGKGHETSILLGKTEYPWSEADAFRTSFRLKK